MLRAALTSMICLAWPGIGAAQVATTTAELYGLGDAAVAAAKNDPRCLAQMARIPAQAPAAQYQFFKLIEGMAMGAQGDAGDLLDYYGAPALDSETPLLSVIEDIANPVLRHSRPRMIVSNFNFLIAFADLCEVYIEGQIDSLTAFDADLSNPEANAAIAADALFLRQTLLESLTRLGADVDPQWAPATQGYARRLSVQKNAAEYRATRAESSPPETLLIANLKQRLAQANAETDVPPDSAGVQEREELAQALETASNQSAEQARLERIVRAIGGGA